MSIWKYLGEADVALSQILHSLHNFAPHCHPSRGDTGINNTGGMMTGKVNMYDKYINMCRKSCPSAMCLPHKSRTKLLEIDPRHM
jgi:hypothetical protein